MQQLEPSEDIETFLKLYEQQPVFDKRLESLLGQKINFMNVRADQSDQVRKLVKFCENIFKSACERLVQ